MNNFQLLADNVDVLPIMHQLQRQPDLWDEHTIRTKHPNTAHSQVNDILIFFNDLDKVITDEDIAQASMEFGPLDRTKIEMARIINDREVKPFRAWTALPALRPLIFALMRQVEAVRLGRVIITKLGPGKEITPHVDGGAPATYFNRYQIALQCAPGNMFNIDGEQVSFRTGQIWWIDNKKIHSVENFGTEDRIVCIVDLRCD